MLDDEKYMYRCLQLAANGKGRVAPNPMVGSVIVHNGKIIGEGFHREYGKAHAEVNAINSVEDKGLLKESTIYVSLEPCSHYGKTPPCSQLIIDSGIPKVVIATPDPYFKVSGRGISMLKAQGLEVIVGVLQSEARSLNKEFFTTQTQGRPYVYLKWAQTKDGFIDKIRRSGEPQVPTPISNHMTSMLVHKLRSEVSAIMIATNTAVNDNPTLTTRLWYGKNPLRVILDRNRRIPDTHKLLNGSTETILFTEKEKSLQEFEKFESYKLIFDEHMLSSLLKELRKRKINSLLVEGGSRLLTSFIQAGLWDEAYIEYANKPFEEGIKAPQIEGLVTERKRVGSSETLHLKNVQNYKIL